MALVEAPRNCPDCQAEPGHTHEESCPVERCSNCGLQRINCGCVDHDPKMAFWTGYWPGDEACRLLDCEPATLNEIIVTRRRAITPFAGRRARVVH